MSNGQGSVFWAAFWMFVVSVLLCWIPGIGGFVAGVVGGMVAGNVARALSAALLPAILLGSLLFFFATALSGIFVIGLLAGLGGVVLGMLHMGMLLLGAIIGGLLA
ncbi:MAG: hypothetical protein ISP90_02485 [Nevskia sp.]|nr:hypothetical protein [Nevskia sp.]